MKTIGLKIKKPIEKDAQKEEKTELKKSEEKKQ